MAQQCMKEFVDRKRRELKFEIEEYMYLKLQPHKQTLMMTGHNEKLSPKYFGPYRTEARVGKVAYRLALPKEASIHLVFYIMQLKKTLGIK